jgi:hypothetical protein
MPILDETELADLRAEMREVMTETEPDLCQVERGVARVRDPNYGDRWSETPNVVDTGGDLPCRYRTASRTERDVADAPVGAEVVAIRVPAGIDLQEKDVIRVLAKGADPEFRAGVVVIQKRSNATKWWVVCVKG